MRRAAFPPLPFPAELPAAGAHPALALITFAAASLVVGLAWSPARLALAAAAITVLLAWPRPSRRPLRALLTFAPLLALIPLFHVLPWRGFAGAGRWPWAYDPAAWPRGLLAAARMGLWILLTARTLDRLHPAACLAALPRRPRLARLALAPLLALSLLELSLREAFLLERAWRARGGAGRGRLRAAHWPSLLVPLFRNVLGRADALADSLRLRRFPARWAAPVAAGPGAGDLLPAALAAAALAALLLPRGPFAMGGGG
ncbi:MAG: hypothetical protein JW819_01355 [Candidatus Krumholzibacteriota bacterium]|nr:hypothetical protein [Candidatus Krumholzibacteriota bacterium]